MYVSHSITCLFAQILDMSITGVILIYNLVIIILFVIYGFEHKIKNNMIITTLSESLIKSCGFLQVMQLFLFYAFGTFLWMTLLVLSHVTS